VGDDEFRDLTAWYPFTFLVRRLDNPKIEQLVDEVRTKFGNQNDRQTLGGALDAQTAALG
jgi:hypothetical protein